MAIWFPISKLNRELIEELIKDLTVIQLDESFEKMKRRGQIMPGYTPDVFNSKIECFHDVDDTLRIPFAYAKSRFKIRPNPDDYPGLDPEIVLEGQPRDYQKPAIKKCFEHLVKHNTVTAGFPPGWGKTFLGAYLSHCLRLKSIVILPRSTLIQQWVASFELVIPKASLWVVEESGRLPPVTPDVIICLDPRILKIPESWRTQIGTLIIDEAHMLPTRTRIESLLSFKPCYVIMETATMERGDGLHKICQLIGGTNGIFETSSTPYKFNIVDLPFIMGEETFTHRGVNYLELCKSLSYIEEYNRVILNIVRKNPDNKFIILTRLVEHGKFLQELFSKSGISCDTLMGTKKKYTNSKVLIGTFSKIGTGFDEATASVDFEGPKSDSLIICHSVAKATPNFEQYRGRVMRSENPNIYWLNVKNKVVRNHLRDIKRHVVETNGTIVNQEGVQYMQE